MLKITPASALTLFSWTVKRLKKMFYTIKAKERHSKAAENHGCSHAAIIRNIDYNITDFQATSVLLQD
ncbi:MAG: hypothetical protein JXN64_03125 [Spirochaetes bacterium]|nr:hypothetical protein [Spirochaetota bacterium]